MSLEAFFIRYLPPLEALMCAVVQPEDRHRAELFGMLHYHLGWADAMFRPCRTSTGKRVRPLMCLLACEASGGDWEQALPAAAAIELLHNFSLVHDDVEDGDKVRRARPTLWVLWGQAKAINAGDALFALSQLALLQLSERGVPDVIAVKAARLFNSTCLALTAGQHLDIGFERQDDVAAADYQTMIEEKTAALISCACEMGALIATASSTPDDARSTTQRRQLGAFGRHLGLSFQIRDDILGVWGDPAITGKAAGADVARHKKSLPILHGLAQSPDLRALLAQRTLSTADVRRATELLEGTESRAYAERLAEKHHGLAITALDRAALSGAAAQALRDLAQILLGRDN